MAALAALKSLWGEVREKEPSFQMVINEEHVQVRLYHSYVVAKVHVESDNAHSNHRIAQMKLLNFVLGRNSQQVRIEPMMPLVQREVMLKNNMLLQLASPEKHIADNAFEIAMVLPSQYSLESAPAPLDDEIKLERVTPHMTAIIKFSGFCGKAKRERLTKYLTLWLHDRGYHSTSAPRLAKYNPPFTLPFWRRNEIHIDVARR